MCGFEGNDRKPDFWAKMAKFWPKKGPKMAPIFCQNKNFNWPFLNNKLSLNNKNWQKIINGFEEMAKNSLKPYNVTTSNVFLTQKMAKTAKTRIFPDTTLPFDDSRQLSPVGDKVLDKSDVRFRRKCPKTWFLRENGQILHQKRVQKWPWFFGQNKNFHWPFLKNKLSLSSKN